MTIEKTPLSAKAGPGFWSTELRLAADEMRPLIRKAAWFSVVISLLALTSTVYMLEVYDRVVVSRSLSTLLMLTLVTLAAYLVLVILEWVRGQVMSAAARQFEAGLGDRIFNAIFSATFRREAGAPQQAMNDLRTLRDLIAAPVLTALMDAPVSLVLLVIIFMISPVLGWCAIFGGFIQLFIAFLTERYSQPPLVLANRAGIAAQTYASGVLRNAQVIEAMGMLPAIRERWMQRQHEFLGLQARAADAAGGLMAASKMVQLTQFSALLGLGCWLYLQGKLEGGGGVMIVVAILGGKVLQPLIQIVASWSQVINGRDAFQRLNRLLQQIPEREVGMSLPAVKGDLLAEGVVATAPGGSVPILRNVNFALPAGEAMAIIGPSAAGKTSLARLLVGVWPTISGKVRLDGADIHHWNKSELGPQVGYLPQTVELFDGSLADNIARFSAVDRTEVEETLRLVGLSEWVATLPKGIDTRLGDNGDFLSGGIRQRVGLARALYGMPSYVVMDEPNSNLDQAGELALLQTMKHLKAKGVTVVVITHRPGLLAAVDRLLVLNEGSVVAFGPRDEVLAAMAGNSSNQRAA